MPIPAGNGPHVTDSLVTGVPFCIGLQAMALFPGIRAPAWRDRCGQGDDLKWSWRKFMQILVRDNNVDQALRALKKKLQREGVYREMKLRRHYEKPSEKRAREKAAAVRRARKLERKRMERDGAK